MEGRVIDVVIPASDEEETVGEVVARLRSDSRIGRVIVVDNGSTDRTATRAANSGAIIISVPERGLGRAVKAGLGLVNTELCLKTDADIANWSDQWLNTLLWPDEAVALRRAIFQSPYDSFPVTNLVVRPLLRRLNPAWSQLPLPITGTYVLKPSAIDLAVLADDWAFDISLLVHALERGLSVDERHIGMLSDRQRPLEHYIPMADEIISYFLSKLTRLA